MKTTITKGHSTGMELLDIAAEYGVTHTFKCIKYSCGCIMEEDLTDVVFIAYMDSCDEFDYIIYEVPHGKTTMICLNVVYQVLDHHFCPKCAKKLNKVYCDSMPKPVGFDSVVIYHGIAAFNTDFLETVYDYYERVVNILRNQDWEICCSTKPIGEIGIVVKGDVICASNADLFTEIDYASGRRFFDKSRHRASHLIFNAKDLDDSKWSHDEIVSKNNSATAVWVYSKASKKIKQYGQYIAKLLKLEYIELDYVYIG